MLNNLLNNSISQGDREHLRSAVIKANELIAPFWPMKTMIAQNPLHGLEYLPFDQAVRKGQQFIGGKGYLSNEEYRQLFQKGRITLQGIKQALARVKPDQEEQEALPIGNRHVSVYDVWYLHLVFEFTALEPVLLQWELSPDGGTKRFRQDLPQDSRSRIIERTIKECEQCRDYPEEAYLTNLWRSILSVLGLSPTASEDSGSDSSQSVDLKVALPKEQTLSDWVGDLVGVALVEQINNQLIKWIAGFVDEGLAGWEMCSRDSGFYATWKNLAQHDHTGRFW